MDLFRQFVSRVSTNLGYHCARAIDRQILERSRLPSPEERLKLERTSALVNPAIVADRGRWKYQGGSKRRGDMAVYKPVQQSRGDVADDTREREPLMAKTRYVIGPKLPVLKSITLEHGEDDGTRQGDINIKVGNLTVAYFTFNEEGEATLVLIGSALDAEQIRAVAYFKNGCFVVENNKGLFTEEEL